MDQFTAHLDRGWDLVSRGDFAGAMVSAKKGLELDRESPEAYNLLGFIHAQDGNVDEALESYRQAIALDETYIEAMLNAAELLIHPVKDTEGAIGMVEEALDYCETPDEIADALLLKSDALLSRGDREGAAAVVSGIPDGPFDNPDIPFRIGRAKFDCGDVEGAAPLVERAVQLQPDNPDAHYYRGLVLESRGDARGATVAFLQTRDLDLRIPDAPSAIPTDQFERRVQTAIHQLPKELAELLEGALVVVCESPGAEVVADGIDPRVPILLDALSPPGEEPPRIGRVFVYQRNVERLAPGILEIEEELVESLRRELSAAFAEPEPEPEPGPTAPEAGGPS